jgi:hypothetical protein
VSLARPSIEAVFSYCFCLIARVAAPLPPPHELEGFLSSNARERLSALPLRFDAVAHIRRSWFTARSEHNPGGRGLPCQFLEAGV